MSKYHWTAFASLSFVILVMTLSAVFGESSATFEKSDEYRSAAGTDIPVLVLSDDPSKIVADLSFGTKNYTCSSEPTYVPDVKAVIIDQNWSGKSNISQINPYISDLIDSGVIVTALGSADIFLGNNNLEFIAFMEDSDSYSVYRATDGTRYVCHSIDDGGSGSAVAKTYCWINEQIESTETTSGNRIMNLPWGTEHSSSGSVYHEGYGYMNIETNYFALQEDNPRYNYYYTHYYQESVPDDNRYTADMYTKTQNSQSNLSYLYHAPTTTPGNSTVTVSIGTEVGLPDIVGANVSVSWNYSVPDVVVNDRSNTGVGLIDIWHDVDEDENVGEYTYYIEPAKLMKVDCQNGSGYCIQRDEYSIQFCKNVWFWKEFSTVNKTLVVYYVGLPHTLTIDSNGADGSIYEDEDPSIFEDVYSTVHSEGTYVTLWDPEYYKIGYTFVGFSTNPESTVADYPINGTIQLLDDTTLYMVWV